VASKRKGRNAADGQVAPRPFLRWAGGKFYLTSALLGFTPSDVSVRRYFEPFLGAGSLFFALRHEYAYLSDLNGHLIECYRAIRDNPRAVALALRGHAERDCERYYYSVREAYNRSRGGVARAARFLYLNRTGFNGVFRVNLAGVYNVPYGRKSSPRFPSTVDLTAIAAVLRGARLSTQDYRAAFTRARSGDFVYLDPPYPPLNGTSFFAHYTPDRFGIADQAQVAACARDLDKRGCLVMVSNADTPAVRKLYRGFVVTRLSVTRYVSSSSIKHQVGELVITNYPRSSMRQAAR
jgi:DNA adenine methylase